MSKSNKVPATAPSTETVVAFTLAADKIVAMRAAGAAAVTSTAAATAILKVAKLTSRKEPATVALRDQFYIGGFAKGRAVSHEEAQRKLSDKALRDDQDETLYGYLKTQWSRACDGADLPKLHIGGNRGTSNAKVNANGAKGETAPPPVAPPVAIEAIHVPTGLDTAGVLAFFAKLSETATRVIAANAANIKGDCGTIIRQCATDVADYVKDATVALAKDNAPRDELAKARAAADERASALHSANEELAKMKAELDAMRAAAATPTATPSRRKAKAA